MSQFQDKDLFGYVIGTNRFNFRDNRMENAINKSVEDDGYYGIRYYKNGFMLVNGGFYDEETIINETANWGSNSHTFTVSISNPQIFLDRINSGTATGSIFIGGTATLTNSETSSINGTYSGTFEPSIDEQTQEVNGFDFVFDDTDMMAQLAVDRIHCNALGTEAYVRFSDKSITNFNGRVKLNANYIVPNPWPADLLDIDGIYTAIVDKLINDGYIQSQS